MERVPTAVVFADDPVERLPRTLFDRFDLPMLCNIKANAGHVGRIGLNQQVGLRADLLRVEKDFARAAEPDLRLRLGEQNRHLSVWLEIFKGENILPRRTKRESVISLSRVERLETGRDQRTHDGELNERFAPEQTVGQKARSGEPPVIHPPKRTKGADRKLRRTDDGPVRDAHLKFGRSEAADLRKNHRFFGRIDPFKPGNDQRLVENNGHFPRKGAAGVEQESRRKIGPRFRDPAGKFLTESDLLPKRIRTFGGNGQPNPPRRARINSPAFGPRTARLIRRLDHAGGGKRPKGLREFQKQFGRRRGDKRQVEIEIPPSVPRSPL